MSSLIRKDLLLQKKMILASLIGLVIYIILDVSPIWVGVIFSLVVSISSFSIDEKARIQLLLNSLPYTRKELIVSKYAVVLLYTIMTAFIIFLGQLMLYREFLLWKDLMFMVIFVLITLSIILPFCYRFGSKYLMVAGIITVGIYLLTIQFVVPNLHDVIRLWVGSLLSVHSGWYIILACAVLFVYGCSGLLSLRIYQYKQI